MGLMTEGHALTFEELQQYGQHVRQHGIRQFINTFKRVRDRKDPTFKWGDEIEYIMVKFDHQNKKVRLPLKSDEMLKCLDRLGSKSGDWTPEVCRFNLESTPAEPYTESVDHPLVYVKQVEPSMKARRREAQQLLAEDEWLLTLTHYPRYGTEDCTHPYTAPDPLHSVLKSQFISEDVMYSSHPRYLMTTHRIKERRGRKVAVNIPIYRDIKTMDPFMETFTDQESNDAFRPDHIYMDSQVLGWGSTCLQLTLLAEDLHQGIHIYDQLAPITPIALALSACTPIMRGYLTDQDCRWQLLSGTADDRTKQELGEVPLKKGGYRLNKSRYDSIDSYLCESNHNYNDIPLTMNQDYVRQMVDEGVPPGLARHVAHLFIRDPPVVMKEYLDQNDETETRHFDVIRSFSPDLTKLIRFELFQDMWSMNWQTLRFKPPPFDPSIGWRVEFRPMDIQLTDFENAAYVVFIVLLSRVILSYKLNLLIPISKIDENMIEAQKRDAVNRSKFWFRKHIFSCGTPDEVQEQFDTYTEPPCCNGHVNGYHQTMDDSCVLMTMNDIINGKDSQFPGLIPVISHFMDRVDIDDETRRTINIYLELISGRAAGRLKTCAKWMRDFVRQHEDYKHDSVVTDAINYDLLLNIKRIENIDCYKKILEEYKSII